MPAQTTPPRELQILEHIEADPNVTQATLAEKLGVAVGTINFAVKRLVRNGYIRVKRLERRRLRYIITPAGIALRTRLAMDSLQYSMRLYRETRAEAKRLIGLILQKGHRQLSIEGDGELAEIVRLTCLEQGVEIVSNLEAPILQIEGARLRLKE